MPRLMQARGTSVAAAPSTNGNPRRCGRSGRGTDFGAELARLLADKMVTVDPADVDDEPGGLIRLPEFANFEVVSAGGSGAGEAAGRLIRRGLPMQILREGLLELTEGWPKRVGADLFVADRDHRPAYLDTPAKLFAWLGDRAQVVWGTGSDMIRREDFYANVAMTAEHFESVETCPHWPPLPDTYYVHPPLPQPTGRHLLRFLEFFSPASPVDADLLLSLVLTVFWGGPPGTRPAFLVVGPQADSSRGRGVGKSTALATIADLAGGFVSCTSNTDIDGLVTRLLSDTARHQRLVRIDNIKTTRFSSADLEALITSSVVSGRRLYHGEGQRPNHLVWGMTFNGATMSKDMAQRSVVIQLARNEHTADRERGVREFVAEHRWSIVADIGALLTDQARKKPITAGFSRWALWEDEVLSRVDRADEAKQVIVERQGDIDDDDDHMDLYRTAVRDGLRRERLDPDACYVIIPVPKLAEWIHSATGERIATTKVSGTLRSLQLPELTPYRDRRSRGWLWRGPRAAADAVPRDLRPGTPVLPIEDGESA